jgi:hypothetical protein
LSTKSYIDIVQGGVIIKLLVSCKDRVGQKRALSLELTNIFR